MMCSVRRRFEDNPSDSEEDGEKENGASDSDDSGYGRSAIRVMTRCSC